ncbi:TPA: hypothetical protein U1B12_001061 [Streptococcus suis]|uniref:hypothetical protein n=1 Tax=Streptococcus suis TaxID=1307 RepID=UPI0018759F85|nr:hypothetical protein [Streptococcus suis]MCO8200839.1 hypothetical protein [Streptococcus suis]MCO8218376.1 hypothetical protein [Streptococcus suis]HEM3467926.1 hypothetical protein [Streptococcus suis]HEM3478637.1 hypothetical protein [Streptococcus suis]
MTKQEKQTRETIVFFLMKEMNLTYQESLANVLDLEKFGLLRFKSSGQFILKEV